MSQHLVRRLLGLLKLFQNSGHAALDETKNGHRNSQAADDTCLCGPISVHDMACQRQEQNAVHDAQVGDYLSRYRDYGVWISHHSIDLANANGWFVGHLKNPCSDDLNKHAGAAFESSLRMRKASR